MKKEVQIWETEQKHHLVVQKNETISNNGEVKLKIEQVRMQTRRNQIKRKPMDEKTKKKMKDEKINCPGRMFWTMHEQQRFKNSRL